MIYSTVCIKTNGNDSACAHNAQSNSSIVNTMETVDTHHHLLKLRNETPVKIALEKALKPCQKSAGKSKTTWVAKIHKDVQQLYQIQV